MASFPPLVFCIGPLSFRLFIEDERLEDSFRERYASFLKEEPPGPVCKVSAVRNSVGAPWHKVSIAEGAKGERQILAGDSRIAVSASGSEARIETEGDAHALDTAMRLLCMDLLGGRPAWLVHAAAGSLDEEKAAVFVGPSGVGKSTIARLIGPEAAMHEEMVCVSLIDGVPFVEATPFFGGGARTWKPARRQVFGFYYPFQSKENGLEPLSVSEAIMRLAPQIAMLPNSNSPGKLIDDLKTLAGAVKNYRMPFTKEPIFWENIRAAALGKEQKNFDAI